MNKRGSIEEYSLDKALRLALVILVAVCFAIAVYRLPNEERINELKVLDFSLALDSVFSVKDDVYLNYDLGEGMNVEFDDKKIKMYQENENKVGEEYFISNLNYDFVELDGGEYENLFIIKEKGEEKDVVKVNGDYGFEGFEEEIVEGF